MTARDHWAAPQRNGDYGVRPEPARLGATHGKVMLPFSTFGKDMVLERPGVSNRQSESTLVEGLGRQGYASSAGQDMG
jgi:hypothetical protein